MNLLNPLPYRTNKNLNKLNNNASQEVAIDGVQDVYAETKIFVVIQMMLFMRVYGVEGKNIYQLTEENHVYLGWCFCWKSQYNDLNILRMRVFQFSFGRLRFVG